MANTDFLKNGMQSGKTVTERLYMTRWMYFEIRKVFLLVWRRQARELLYQLLSLEGSDSLGISKSHSDDGFSYGTDPGQNTAGTAAGRS